MKENDEEKVKREYQNSIVEIISRSQRINEKDRIEKRRKRKRKEHQKLRIKP